MIEKIRKRLAALSVPGKKTIYALVGGSAAMWIAAAAVILVFKYRNPHAAEGRDPHAVSAEEGMAAAGFAGHSGDAGGKETSGGHEESPHGVPASESAESSGADTHGGGAHAGSDQVHGAGDSHGSIAHAGDAVASLEPNRERGDGSGEGAEGEGHGTSMPSAVGPAGYAYSAEPVPSPSELAALRQVAELQAAAGRPGEAITPLRRVLLAPSPDPALLALAGRVFLETGNFAEAAHWAARLAETDPGDMENRVRLVEALYRMGDVGQAMREAEAALARHPGNLAMLVGLGSIQIERGPGFDGYGEALAKALELDAGYGPALYLKGRKAQLEGDFRDAEAIFAGLRRREPGNTKALGQLGMAQYHLGKRREAETSFRGVLAENPFDYNTWYNLGEVLLGYAASETNAEAVRHFRNEAMECYLKTIEGNPYHAQARYRVGVLLVGNGQYKEAVRQLEATLRLDSRHVQALLQLSVAYEKLRDTERARECLTRAIELDPLNKIALDRLRRFS